MADLTKKDIKELLDSKIDPFARSVQNEFNKVDKRFNSLEGEMSEVKSELSQVRADVSWMKENTSELFTKLDKFIKLYEDQKEELIILSEQVQKLENRVQQLEAKK